MMSINTQVAIVGGGPAGMLLAHVLGRAGIQSVVIERQTREYVLARIRAGILEHGTAAFLREVGLGERMDREGTPKRNALFAWEDVGVLDLDIVHHTGNPWMVYGQTSLTEDLYQSHEQSGRLFFGSASDVCIHRLDQHPEVTFTDENGQRRHLHCDWIAGCDGFHGISRQAIPKSIRTEWERVYPLGWVGIMAEVPPIPQMVYARSKEGFALTSRRHDWLSRYYIQCAISDTVEDWPDERFWASLKARLPEEHAAQVISGPSIEKSIAPLRSFVSAPMQYRHLFLAGDAAHIVPPTGAKGLNLAVSDVYYLSRALIAHYRDRNNTLLEKYSDTALSRVWKSVNLSWRATMLMHHFPEQDPFEFEIQRTQFQLLLDHEPLRAAFAYELAGVPFQLEEGG